jgi:hypothetical protein
VFFAWDFFGRGLNQFLGQISMFLNNDTSNVIKISF